MPVSLKKSFLPKGCGFASKPKGACCDTIWRSAGVPYSVPSCYSRFETIGSVVIGSSGRAVSAAGSSRWKLVGPYLKLLAFQVTWYKGEQHYEMSHRLSANSKEVHKA